MEDVDQESYFTHLLQLFLSGDQVKKMYDYLLECGVHDFELPGNLLHSLCRLKKVKLII